MQTRHDFPPAFAAAALLALGLSAPPAQAQDTPSPEEQAYRKRVEEVSPDLGQKFKELEKRGYKVRPGPPPPAAPAAGDAERAAAEYAYRRGDYRTAMERYQALAKQGDTEASIILGTMYEEGRGVRRDKAAAYAWYGRAADLGDPTAKEIVRGMNDRDDLSEADYKKAQEKFEELAREYDEGARADSAARRFEKITGETNVNTHVYER